ncbi:hypothetical protein HY227_00510 [Candidatus Wolfebacteria bacterium]|nr:hypothetical protein [Candidatus Wolfebacteria bacterium]
MNLENLLNNLLEEGKIKKQETDNDFLNGLLSAARQNFLAAKYTLEGEFYDTAFKSTYDGLLQISRVILFINGYRPDDGEQHKTTFLVAGAHLGDNFSDLIGKIDRYRIKRNNAVYQPINFISKTEAMGILESAKEYWSAAKKYFKIKNKQLELFDF